MDEMRDATDRFVVEIKSTRKYRDYKEQKEKIKEWPELKAKLDEYRIRNFELQNSADKADLFDEIDLLQNEYESLRDDKRVAGFLEAEVAFCRMMQEVNQKIAEEIEFE